MRLQPRTLVGILACASLVLAGACGGRGAAGPKKYPVSGTVRQDGKPVEGATVTFISTDGKSAATGKTDSTGKYQLVGGAVAGTYNVKIEKYEALATPAGGSQADIAEDKSYKPAPEGAEPVIPKNLLPAKYADPQQSGLTAAVKEGENTFDFDIK